MTGGQRIIVTGGTGALGNAIVRALVAVDAKVGFTFCNAERKARELCEALPAVRARRLDLLRVEDIAPTLGALADELGGVTGLVHAAGLASVKQPAIYDALEDIDAAGWDRLFGVNVKGAAFAVQALAPRLTPEGGNIVFVGALSGVKIAAAPAAYAASKAALVGLTEALAKELGPKNIRVNVIAPGLLETGASANVPEKLRNEYLKHSALKRFGTLQELATVAAHFATANTYVTGRAIAVDGGL